MSFLIKFFHRIFDSFLFIYCIFGLLFPQITFSQEIKKRILIGEIKIEKEVPTEIRKTIKAKLEEYILKHYKNIYEVLSYEDVIAITQQTVQSMKFGCDKPKCIWEITKLIEADEILYGKIFYISKNNKIGLVLKVLEKNLSSKKIKKKSIISTTFFLKDYKVEIPKIIQHLLFPDQDKLHIESEISKQTNQKTFKNTIGMEFVFIPAGEFKMGCSSKDILCQEDERPLHTVKISKPFFIGKYEVTQHQWQTVMGDNPSYFKNCGKNCPVENISWNEAKIFLEKLNTSATLSNRTSAKFMVSEAELLSNRTSAKKNSKNKLVYRLPTEAEWEYVALGNKEKDCYQSHNVLEKFAWYYLNSNNKTHPVGQKSPNSYGLYDTLGNVWEWTEDHYDEDFYKNMLKLNPVNLSSDNFSRVLRGGSWKELSENLRPSYRNHNLPYSWNNSTGLRVVASFR